MAPETTTGLFTLAGVLLGAFVTYRFAAELAARNGKREAGRRLREAFSSEIALLHPATGSKNVNTIAVLQSAFLKHSAAISEFRFYLSGKKLRAFDEAWRQYYEIGGSVRFTDYEIGENPRRLFLQRVESILQFTQ
jgi:hypothetical protein